MQKKVSIRKVMRMVALQTNASTMRATPSDLRDSAADHEAAHAVVGIRCGLPVTRLHIHQSLVSGPNGELGLSDTGVRGRT